MTTKVAPSLLSADFARLGEEAEATLAAGADWLHVDVMDGHFVPNLTIGAPVVRSLRARLGPVGAYLDCHLMVTDPARWVDDFASAGASGFTFHFEATTTAAAQQQQQQADDATAALLRRVRAAGMRAGLALKPGTAWDALVPFADAGLVDLALVMTVEPGFGGQAFMRDALPKVAQLRRRYGCALDVEVDGGLDGRTVVEAAGAGANVIVAGSAVFRAQNRAEAIAQLRVPFNSDPSC